MALLLKVNYRLYSPFSHFKIHNVFPIPYFGCSEYCESVIQIFIKSMTGYIVTKPRPICTILSRLERDLNGHQTNAGDDKLLQTIDPLYST